MRATSSHITAAFTAALARPADREHAVVGMQHRRRAVAGQGRDDALADVVVADDRERADRDLAAELVGHRGDHARDRLAARRPGAVAYVRVGVHHAADLGHVPGTRRHGRRCRLTATRSPSTTLAVEVAHDIVSGGELVIADTRSA